MSQFAIPAKASYGGREPGSRKKQTILKVIGYGSGSFTTNWAQESEFNQSYQCPGEMGKFNNDQKRVYEKVLTLQKELIEMVKPGANLKDLNDKTIDGLVEIMLEEGLLEGNKADIIIMSPFDCFQHPSGFNIPEPNLPFLSAGKNGSIVRAYREACDRLA